jgi:hypothetical protein
MFNELGAPWPQHSCFDEQYKKLKASVLAPLQAAASPKSATFQAFQILKDHFEPAGGGGEGSPISSHPDTPTVPVGKSKVDLPAIKPMQPFQGDEQSFIGVVRELKTKTAKIAQLYASVGNVGAKALDLPAQSKAIQLTIVDTAGEPKESFTCIVDQKVLGSAVGEGVMVFATLVAKSAPAALFWLATSVEPL